MSTKQPAPIGRHLLILLATFVASATALIAVELQMAASVRNFLATAQQQSTASLASAPVHTAGLPVRLRIPRLKVNASVQEVGLTPGGNMDVPTKPWDVGWYKFGPRPGEAGNAVIAGHLDSKTGPAVFWRLKEVKVGDDVYVTDEDGKTHHFRVVRTHTYDADTSRALTELFGPSTTTDLNLITCDGTWNKAKGQYTKRLAVFAQLTSF